MKKSKFLCLSILMLFLSACGSSIADTGQNPSANQGQNNNSNNSGNAGNVTPPIKSVTFDMISGSTWEMQSFIAGPAGYTGEYQNVDIVFNSDGSLGTKMAKPLFDYSDVVYHAPAVSPGGEYVSLAPEGAITNGDLFDVSITYEVTETPMKPILRIKVTGTFYPSCYGNQIGECAQSGFDPTPYSQTRSVNYVMDIKDQSTFALQTSGYYLVFVKK